LDKREEQLKDLRTKEQRYLDQIIKENEQRVYAMNRIQELETQVGKLQVQTKIPQQQAQQSSKSGTSAADAAKSPAAEQGNLGEEIISRARGFSASGLLNNLFGGPSVPLSGKHALPPQQGVAPPVGEKKKIVAALTIPSNIKNKVTTGAQINAISWSSDNFYLAIGCSDKSAKVYNAASMEEMSQCQLSNVLNDTVMNTVFSPNSHMLALSCADGLCHVCSIPSGKLKHTFSGHMNKVCAVDFNSDNTRLVTGSHDRTMRIYDVTKGDLLKTFQNLNSSVNDLEISDYSDILVSAHYDGSVRFHDIRAQKHIQNVKLFISNPTTSVNISRDCQYVLCNSGQELKIVDLRTFEVMKTLTHEHFYNKMYFNKAAFSPTGDYVAAGSSNGDVFIWDVKLSKVVQTLSYHKYVNIWCVAILALLILFCFKTEPTLQAANIQVTERH